MTKANRDLIPSERIENRILLLRGQKVMLDRDLAALYEVETKALKRAVKRNINRFPDDFMFILNGEEVATLRCQFGTSKQQFRVVFDALRDLTRPPEPPRKQIGFGVRERRAAYRIRKGKEYRQDHGMNGILMRSAWKSCYPVNPSERL